MSHDSAKLWRLRSPGVHVLAAAKAIRHAEYLAVELDSFDGDMLQAIKESYCYLTAHEIAQGTK